MVGQEDEEERKWKWRRRADCHGIAIKLWGLMYSRVTIVVLHLCPTGAGV